jgi:2-C-methyl-D-erythritol 4-phosphate cytidylyltransferase
VLVHDAVRPCLRHTDLDNLMDGVHGGDVGAILGVPVADTVKRVDDAGHIQETVPRDDLWRALTPQMFRWGELVAALEDAQQQGVVVTDEASAMERVGARPRIIEGHSDNIKITAPADLALAEVYIRLQMEARW